MQDGLLRRIVKAVARGMRRVDLTATRWVLSRRGEPRYRLTGTCSGCGRCCEAPTVAVSRITWHLRALALWWHRVVNGFEFQQADPRFRLLAFRCTHYDEVTKQCDSYPSRPLMCRDYPTNLLFEALPPLFDDCSHGVVLASAARFREALARLDLPPEERTALEKKLHLIEETAPSSQQGLP